ncbi:hypothetical protein [Microbacterium sp. NPDC091662]|uniref:hypothetical protein n=1 Tax=Microbacterium sp. NPDC091662 TaxID=3364211 RepID=UPI0038278AAE
MMITGPIKKSRLSARRIAHANTVITPAVHDFRFAWIPDAIVEVSATGTYAGRPVVAVSFSGLDYIVGHESDAHLVAQTARLLQVVATRGNTQWPTIPGTGPLTPTIHNGHPIWATATGTGTKFCDIGHLFPLAT